MQFGTLRFKHRAKCLWLMWWHLSYQLQQVDSGMRIAGTSGKSIYKHLEMYSTSLLCNFQFISEFRKSENVPLWILSSIFFCFFLRIVLVLFKISFYGSILIILYTLNKKKKIRKHKRISYYYSLLYHFASTYSRFCQNEIRLSILVSRHQILSGPVPWHNSISWKNPVSKTIWVQRFKCLSPRATFFVI